MSVTRVWFSSRWILPRKTSRTPRQQPYCRASALCSFQKAKCFPLLRVHSALQQEKLCARRISRFNLVVGSSGLEPPTSRLSGVCSNQLSYEPISSARGRRPHSCGFRHDGCCRENSLAPRVNDNTAVRSACAVFFACKAFTSHSYACTLLSLAVFFVRDVRPGLAWWWR